MEHTRIISGRRFRVLILTSITALLMYVLFCFWSGWNDFIHAVDKVGLLGVFVALIFAFSNIITRFTRFRKYLRVLGYQVPFFQCMRIYFSGFAFSITPGKAGESIRCIFLKDYHIPYRSSFGAFVSERFSDGISSLLLISGGLYFVPEIRPLFWFTLLGMLIFLFLIHKRRFLAYVRLMIGKLRGKSAQLALFLFHSVRDIRSCFRFPIMLYGTCLGLMAWVLESFGFYYLLVMLGYDIGVLQTIMIYNLALFVGAISFLPGGVGGSEIVMLELLRYNHVPLSDAAAAVIIIRLATVWFPVVLGLLALPRKIGINSHSIDHTRSQ